MVAAGTAGEEAPFGGGVLAPVPAFWRRGTTLVVAEARVLDVEEEGGDLSLSLEDAPLSLLFLEEEDVDSPASLPLRLRKRKTQTTRSVSKMDMRNVKRLYARGR